VNPSGEARDAQHPHRVFDERRRDVPQGALAQIALTAERIDQRAAVGILRNRVDRQVAALQVLLERHVGREQGLEAAVARAGLALGAGQRVFLGAARVQEHREILADGLVPLRKQLFGARADDHPVPLPRRQTEQLIAHCAADEINSHSHVTVSNCQSADDCRRGAAADRLLPDAGGRWTDGDRLQARADRGSHRRLGYAA
jgi:hypothetical protein